MGHLESWAPIMPTGDPNLEGHRGYRDRETRHRCFIQDLRLWGTAKAHIHGRSQVGFPEEEEKKRWLLRTYTQNTKEKKYCIDPRGTHILCVSDYASLTMSG